MRPLILLLALGVFPATASAQETSEQIALAKERFREAGLAHERGAPAEAARLFEEAYRLAPRAQALFNAAVAWQAAGEPGRAADAFETALATGGLEEPNQTQARERLTLLKRTLAYLSVPEPLGGQVSVSHLERVSIPISIHLSAGTYLVRVQYPDGTSVSSKLQLAAGQSHTLPLPRVLPKSDTGTAQSTPPAQSQASAPRGALEVSPEERAGAPSGQRTWGWVGVGAGAALAGSAIILGVKFLQANQAWDDSGHRALEQRSKAQDLRIWTNVAWAGAAASAGTGLWLLASPKLEF